MPSSTHLDVKSSKRRIIPSSSTSQPTAATDINKDSLEASSTEASLQSFLATRQRQHMQQQQRIENNNNRVIDDTLCAYRNSLTNTTTSNNNNNTEHAATTASSYRQRHSDSPKLPSTASSQRFSSMPTTTATTDNNTTPTTAAHDNIKSSSNNKRSSRASSPPPTTHTVTARFLSLEQQPTKNCSVSNNNINEADAPAAQHVPFTGYCPQPQEIILRGIENSTNDAKSYNEFIFTTGQVCGAFCRLIKAREKQHEQLQEYQRSCQQLERELKRRDDELTALTRQHELTADEARQNREKLHQLVRKVKDEEKISMDEKQQLRREIDQLERECSTIKWNKQLETQQIEKLKDEITQKQHEIQEQNAQNEKLVQDMREQMRAKQQQWQDELRKLKHEQHQQEQKYQIDVDACGNELQNSRHELQMLKNEHSDQAHVVQDMKKQWSDLNASFQLAQRQCDEKDRQLQHVNKEYSQTKRNFETMAVEYDEFKQRRVVDLQQIQQEMAQREKEYALALKKLTDERTSLKDDIKTGLQTNEHLQKSYDAVRQQHTDLQRQHSELSQQHQTLMKNYNTLEQNFMNSQNNLDTIRHSLTDTKAEYTRTATTLRDELDTKHQELLATKQTFVMKFQELQNSLQMRDADNERLRKNLKHYKAKSESAQRERYACEAQVTAMQEQQDEMTKALNENNITIAKQRAELEEHERRSGQVSGDLAQCRKEHTALKHSERELKEKLERYQAMYDNLETETRSMELNAQRLRSENDLLKRRLERRMQQSLNMPPVPHTATTTCAYNTGAATLLARDNKPPPSPPAASSSAATGAHCSLLLNSTRSALQLIGGGVSANHQHQSDNTLMRRTMGPPLSFSNTDNDNNNVSDDVVSGAGLISKANAVPPARRFDFLQNSTRRLINGPSSATNIIATRSERMPHIEHNNNNTTSQFVVGRPKPTTIIDGNSTGCLYSSQSHKKNTNHFLSQNNDDDDEIISGEKQHGKLKPQSATTNASAGSSWRHSTVTRSLNKTLGE